MNNIFCSGFIENVIAGLSASILTWIFIYFGKFLLSKRIYGSYAGRYGHYDIITNARISNEVTELKHIRDNLLLTKCISDLGDWEGRIQINQSIPDIGSGVYQYLLKADCGIHQIQRDTKKGIIFVHVVNTSHGKNFSTSCYWKKLAE